MVMSNNTVGDFTGTAVELVIGEPVIAPEASYGLALLGNKLKSRMRGHGIATTSRRTSCPC
jgi:hypothetical protein